MPATSSQSRHTSESDVVYPSKRCAQTHTQSMPIRNMAHHQSEDAQMHINPKLGRQFQTQKERATKEVPSESMRASSGPMQVVCAENTHFGVRVLEFGFRVLAQAFSLVVQVLEIQVRGWGFRLGKDQGSDLQLGMD